MSSIRFVCILVSLTVAYALSPQENLTAYDVLEQYGFPAGLLPKGATGYDLNPETGAFSAYLDRTCKFSVEGYQLKYKRTISGVISQGKLTKLKGVSVKVLLWFDIVEVTRHGDELQFSVGVAYASFEADNFLESPQCGCGFDCYNSRKIKNGVVSSI